MPADFVNPKELPEGTTIVDKLIEMTDGGCDFTFDATGNVSVLTSTLRLAIDNSALCRSK
jgi:S-(hydroxymethyl)glutathione dehydrogenase/alcohol dehydrogenase